MFFGNLENGKGVARQNRNQATQKFGRLASTEITLCGIVGMIQIPCKLIDVPKVASVHCSEYVVFILIHFWYLVFLFNSINPVVANWPCTAIMSER